MTEQSHSIPSLRDTQKSPASKPFNSNRSNPNTATFDEGSSIDCAPESPTLPPDMARDEGFTDISNGDDLKLGPPELSPYVAPQTTSKHTYVYTSNNNNNNINNNNNPIASFVSTSDSSQPAQTTSSVSQQASPPAKHKSGFD
ncbi:unnamed protein product [Absidia cylindrospora]